MQLKTLSFLLILFSITTAGPNSGAKLYINFDTSSSFIDSTGVCNRGDTFVSAIYATGLAGLYDFQVTLEYDTTQLQFVSYLEDFGSVTNVLKKNGGNIFSKCSPSRQDSTRLIVAASLLETDAAKCVSGNGYLMFIKFSKKTSDTTELLLSEALLENFDAIADTEIETHSGMVVSGTSGTISKVNRPLESTFRFSGSVVTIRLERRAPAHISIHDIKGRILQQATTRSGSITLTLPQSSSGMYLLTVNQDGKRNSYRYTLGK